MFENTLSTELCEHTTHQKVGQGGRRKENHRSWMIVETLIEQNPADLLMSSLFSFMAGGAWVRNKVELIRTVIPLMKCD